MKVYMSEMYEVMPTVAIAHADQAGSGMDILDARATELKKYADVLGYNVIDICGSDLTYECMTDILQVTKPAVLFNFSYGCKEYLMGNPVNGIMRRTLTSGNDDCPTPSVAGASISQEDSEILYGTNNLHAVAGTAVIAYSSHAASQLGPEIIKAGSPAFVGFSEDLVIVSDDTKTQDIFRDALLPLAKRILQGWTVGAAVEATRIDLVNKIKEYKVKGSDLISLPMFYNRRSLTLLGDPNWKLKGVQPQYLHFINPRG